MSARKKRGEPGPGGGRSSMPSAVDSSIRLLYDKQGAAQQLSISVRSLEYYLANKALDFTRIGVKVMISRKELIRFAACNHFGPVRGKQKPTDATTEEQASQAGSGP